MHELVKRDDWVFELKVDGHEYRVIWQHISRKDANGVGEHWIVVEKDGKEVREDGDLARAAAQTYRQLQVRGEYKFPDFIDYANNIDEYPEKRKERLKEIILDLFERVQKGEYLGQYNNELIYVQEVQRILDEHDTLSLVDELVAENRLGLNGMILTTAEASNAAFKYWEENTGHKRLSVGDWGYWGCAFCGAHGDPEDSMKTEKCEQRKEGA